MLDGHRIGVRVKRHRDLRHNKILDFIETLPKDENGEIMKTVLSNHVFNALFLYARLLKGEISITDNGTSDILTSLQMQSSVPVAQTTIKQATAVAQNNVPEPEVMPLQQIVEDVSIPVDNMVVEKISEVAVENVEKTEEATSAADKPGSIRESRPRFGKTLSRG